MQSDLELLAAWREGDKRAANALLRRHFEPLYRFFRNKVDEGADELIQRTFVASLAARDRLREDGNFRAYLFTIARHELYRFLRERKAGRDADFEVSSIIDLGASPTQVVAKRERDKLILLALRGIPLELQIVLELHYWEGLSGTELAAVLEVPLGTVKTRLRRAKQLLAERIPEIAESPEMGRTTVDGLDGWAAELRERVRPPSAD